MQPQPCGQQQQQYQTKQIGRQAGRQTGGWLADWLADRQIDEFTSTLALKLQLELTLSLTKIEPIFYTTHPEATTTTTLALAKQTPLRWVHIRSHDSSNSIDTTGNYNNK